MLDLKLDINEDYEDGISINIILDESALDGGVYMFLIDDLPLYIGETNIFLTRIADHLYELKKDRSYFGLKNLKGMHKITYMILVDGLPYVESSENLKRKTDKNRSLRIKKQNEYIDDYKPLTQNPNFDIGESGGWKRKKDNMIKDSNNVVEKGLKYHRDDYIQILKQLNLV